MRLSSATVPLLAGLLRPLVATSVTVSDVNELLANIANPNISDITLAVSGSPYMLPSTISGVIRTLAIRAETYGVVTISGGNARTLIEVISAAADVHFHGLVLRDGYPGSNSGSGGCAWVSGGHLRFTQCTLTSHASHDYSGSDSGGFGGAFYLSGGTITLTSSEVSNNIANKMGGVALMYGGIFVAHSTSFINNTVTGADTISGIGGGGLFHVVGGNTLLSDCTIHGNSAGYGGVLEGAQGSHVWSSCQIYSNRAIDSTISSRCTHSALA